MEISSAPDSLLRWTSREIEDRLGISALKVEKSVLGAREIAAIREAAIVRIEVYLHPLQCDYHDPIHVSEIKNECQSHVSVRDEPRSWVPLFIRDTLMSPTGSLRERHSAEFPSHRLQIRLPSFIKSWRCSRGGSPFV